jgi:hypothetical protein
VADYEGKRLLVKIKIEYNFVFFGGAWRGAVGAKGRMGMHPKDTRERTLHGKGQKSRIVEQKRGKVLLQLVSLVVFRCKSTCYHFLLAVLTLYCHLLIKHP